MKHIPLIILLITTNLLTDRSSFGQNQVSKNVIIPEDSMYIKQLDRYRKIRICLPPSYNNSEKQYPVLYMTDAQNLFDPETSYVGEWNVDEILDSLYETDGFELIVIGIDHGGIKRMNEYSPWENKRFVPAEGEAMGEFVVNVLKPMIDSTYRTQPDKKHTAIAGSSMGGLFSHYMLFRYPNIFSKAGILSPSYWFSKEVFEFTDGIDYHKEQKVYLLIEGKGGNMVTNAFKMKKVLHQKGFTEQNLKYVNDTEAKHNEAFWRTYFPDMLNFLFSNE